MNLLKARRGEVNIALEEVACGVCLWLDGAVGIVITAGRRDGGVCVGDGDAAWREGRLQHLRDKPVLRDGIMVAIADTRNSSRPVCVPSVVEPVVAAASRMLGGWCGRHPDCDVGVPQCCLHRATHLVNKTLHPRIGHLATRAALEVPRASAKHDTSPSQPQLWALHAWLARPLHPCRNTAL